MIINYLYFLLIPQSLHWIIDSRSHCQKKRDYFPYFIFKQKDFKLIGEPAYIFSNPSNKLFCYNMIGNVAEMVQEKGIAKGGSWKHPLEECKIENRLVYNSPQVWLGFRCVCEVTAKKVFVSKIE